MNSLMELAEELRRLEAAATKGPWNRRGPDLSLGLKAFVQAPRAESHHPYDIEVLGEDETLYPTRLADCDLIVALRNNAPRLIAALRLAESVDNYGRTRVAEHLAYLQAAGLRAEP